MAGSVKSTGSRAVPGYASSLGPEAFFYQSILGRGGFGNVYKVVCKSTDEVCAMKVLERSKLETGNGSRLKYAITEREVMSKIRHPYVVGLRAAFQTDRHLALVLQYCGGGTLDSLIRKRERLSTALSRHYCAQVLLALVHMHSLQVCHRDLKPLNIMLDNAGHAMVADFGLSKQDSLSFTSSFLGSPQYMAPEVLSRSGHDHTVDIYGLGVLLHNCLTGQPPFYHGDRVIMWHNVKQAKLELPDYIPPDAADCLQQLLERNPAVRLGANDTAAIQEHQFFEPIDFNALFRRELPPPLEGRCRVPSSSGRSNRSYLPQSTSQVDDSQLRRDIFGREKACERVLACLGVIETVAPVEGWDYIELGGD
jgi:serine/threonine protein kinase